MRNGENEAKKKAEIRAGKLRALIDKHRKLYHEEDAPLISDEAYDSLVKELIQIEAKFKDLETSDSPTMRVGGAVKESFTKIEHQVSQWSFDNVFDEKEFEDWEDRNINILKKKHGHLASNKSRFKYCAELKIDGLKIILTYKNGVLQSAATRGDGKVGEDITENIKTVSSVPIKLTNTVNIIAVGEAWMSKRELVRINKERERNGEQVFANTRNAAAGSLRQLDTKVTASRRLDTFIYDVDFFEPLESGIKVPTTQEEELNLLESLGFSVNEHYKICGSKEEVFKMYKLWQEKKDDEDYGIDGLAVKINEKLIQEALGYTAKSPRFGVAFKFEAEQATTKIEKIILQVGRTGVITPVAELVPVVVAGSTVSRATLHNEDEIKRLDVRVGDTVILQKAGDVIPDIVRVLKELRVGTEKPFVFPKKLADCGGDGSIERIPGQAAYRCVYPGSFVERLRKIEYFASKKAFNIDGLGPKIVELLMENNLISSYADIFTLKKGDLQELSRFGELSADNLIKAIEKAKKITLGRFLTALSIPQVGEETAIDIAKHFGSINKIKQASFNDFLKINGVGEVVAKSITGWLKDRENNILLEKILEHISIENEKPKTGRLSGKTLVFTGALLSISRDEAKELTRQEGGKVSSSVSKETDYVVSGDEAGEKYDKALKLGVKIIDEKEFLRLIGRS